MFQWPRLRSLAAMLLCAYPLTPQTPACNTPVFNPVHYPHTYFSNMYKKVIFAVALCISMTMGSVSAEEHLRSLQYNPSGDHSQMQKEMLKVVNQKRAENGLEPLCLNKKLVQAAQAHSEDQARSKRMSHTGSDGSSMSQRMKAAGFNWNSAAENVAAGQQVW